MAISDKDLDRMTKPVDTVDDRGPDFRFTEEELFYPPEGIDDRGPDFRFTEEELKSPAGISAMQEQSFEGVEGAQELIANIRTGLNDPARAMSEGATEEDVAMVQSMTDSQLLEFVTEMSTHAEKEGMGEESAEDKAIRLVTGQEGRSMSDSDKTFWATSGRQFDEAFDPTNPMESVLVDGPRDEYGFSNKRPVNTNGRADAGLMVRPTLFDAYQDKNDPGLKTITTGKVTTTVPMGLDHMQHANAHVQKLLGTYTAGKLLDMVEEGSPDQEIIIDAVSKMGGAMDKFNELGDPRDINFAPTGMNRGGPVKYYNRGGLASMGRGGDSQLAHVMPGETMVPPGVMDDGMLDAAFVRAGLDPNQYKVGSPQASVNPRTGMPEYGLGNFFKRLFKKVKKLAPAIGALVGFSYGGAKGAGIGKVIGGVIKTGDLDFQKALSDFGTGWSLGKVGEGFGLQGGEPGDFSSRTSIFKGSDAGGMWGKAPNIAMGDEANTAGGMLQNIGARIAGGEDMELMEQFKNLPMAHKLAVGALGLNALSQTGMFDEEELGDTPPEIRQGIAELRDYHSQPLRAANQVEYNFDPSLGQPIGVTEYSNQNKSLKQLLEELKSDSIGYQPSTISYG